MHHNILDNLLNTFLHSIAWHTGTKAVSMFWVPLLVLFIGYGLYKLYKSWKMRGNKNAGKY